MTTKKSKATMTPSQAEELEAFAHHLAEVLRIARTHPLLTTRFYRDLGGAWNECINELKTFSDSSIQESEEYIRLALKMEAEREGGAK
jgi:hypothetical protein